MPVPPTITNFNNISYSFSIIRLSGQLLSTLIKIKTIINYKNINKNTKRKNKKREEKVATNIKPVKVIFLDLLESTKKKKLKEKKY